LSARLNNTGAMPSQSPLSTQPPFLLLGRVLRPHGVRGELRVEVLTAYPERIMPESYVYIGPDPDDASTATERRVVGVRKHSKYLILQLEHIRDRTAAEPLRSQYVMVALNDAVPLEEGEFYLYQVIGISVYTAEDEYLGDVSEVIETGANDVYVVHGPRGEILLPAIEDCILNVDVNAKKMIVQLLDGLVDN
jgi:16S rRNA processing protein RimM